MPSTLAPSALEFATRWHASQRRTSDGTPFIEHPIEVARLLRDAGCSEDVVVAGLLHDVLEDTPVTLGELERRFGPVVASLVGAVSEDPGIVSYRQRKHALRDQVRAVGGDAALLFAADKISKVRELRDRAAFDGTPTGGSDAVRDSERLRLEHYHGSLAMLRCVAPRHPLVMCLATELAACRPGRAGRSRTREPARAWDGPQAAGAT